MKLLVVGATLIGTTLASPAVAKTSPFVLCDLHAAPHGKSDGREAPDIRHANDVRGTAAAVRIQACTDALASPDLISAFWARRIDLLSARAVLELSSMHRPEAFADLDAVAAVGGSRDKDVLYARSAGLGLAMLRATAADQPTLAIDRWVTISAARPYDLPVQIAAVSGLVGNGASYAAMKPVMDRYQRLGTDQAAAVVDVLLDLGEWRAALRLGDTLPHDDGATSARTGPPFPVAFAALLQVARRNAEVQRRFRLAYAHAALGDAAEARAAVTATPDQARTWAADVPATGRDAKALAPFGISTDRAAMQSNATIKAWTDLVEARLALDAGKPVDLKALMADEPQYVPEAQAVLKAAVARDRGADADALGRAELIRMRVAGVRKSRLDPGIVYGQRPPAEAADNMTPFHRSGSLFKGATGWKAEPRADGTTTVTFTGYVPSHAVAEMALLGAAAVAREAGKPAFVILRQTSGAMTNVYSGAQSDQSTMIVMRPIDDERSPLALRVADVEGTLLPIYAGVTGPT